MNTGLIFDQKARVGAWVAGGDPLGCYGHFYAMGAERNGELVAGIVIDHVNGANGYAHVRINRAGKDVYALIRAFFDYAFRQCGLKRITAMCPSTNEKALEFDRKVGFAEEYRIADGVPDGDMVVMVMRPETCRWLEQRTET